MNFKDIEIKIGSFFSGIGSPEKALEKLKKENYIKDYKLEFFSEIDKQAIKSYCAIHSIDEKLNIGNIINVKGEELPYCDIWIGGFPCQDISCAGKMKGFDAESSTRSSLGWEMIRLLSEVKEKPAIIIFENVSMITSKKFKNTLSLFKADLENLGYNLYDDLLCATDYGIPQTRTRYFLIAVLKGNKEISFPKKLNSNLKIKDFIDNVVDEKYYLTNLNDISNNDKVILKHKNRVDIEYELDMQKFNSGGICGKDKHSKYEVASRLFSENGNAPTLTACNTSENAKIVVKKNDKIRIRRMTAKECWRLMGFTDDDYNKASKVCSETSLYRQAGNSIVVNVIYAVLKSLVS